LTAQRPMAIGRTPRGELIGQLSLAPRRHRPCELALGRAREPARGTTLSQPSKQPE
jgi:hypothetical protein